MCIGHQDATIWHPWTIFYDVQLKKPETITALEATIRDVFAEIWAHTLKKSLWKFKRLNGCYEDSLGSQYSISLAQFKDVY